MISRRNLLAGLSLLPMAGGVASCSARAMVAPNRPPPPPSGGSSGSPSSGAAPPVVSPGARWTGAPLSGGTPPTDPVRTTAKPAVQWWQPSENRLSSDLVIGVDADALGGVAYVDFWVEGTVQRTTQSLYVDTDVNGNTRKRLGYWITLNSAAFKAVSTTGSARIFATAHPNDATMQDRTIGNTRVTSGSSGNNGDRQMIVYPRTTESDFDKTVGSGGNFPSLDAWIVAAKAANAEAARATIITSAFYELTTVGGGPTPYVGAKGFHVIRAAGGVSATIGRAAFPTGPSSTFPIDPLIECLEFRGSGITIDFRNFGTIGTNVYARGHRFNGCNLTNSIGDRDVIYWNKGTVQAPQGSPAPGYLEDCVIHYVTGGSTGIMTYQLMATGNQVFKIEGHAWTGTKFAANNYVKDFTPGFFRTPVAAMTLAYDGHSSSTATASKTGGNDSGTGNGGNGSGGTLVLASSLGGTASKTYTLGQIASDTWFNISAIVADINANVTGWTATLVDDTRRASALLGHGFGSTNGFANQPVTSTPLPLDVWFDQHCDVLQFYSGGGVQENLLHRGNIVVDLADLAVDQSKDPGIKTFLMDSAANDFVITDCAYSAPASGATIIGTETHSHIVLRNLTHEGSLSMQVSTDDAYCRWEQCVIGQTDWDPATGRTPFTFTDCYIAYNYRSHDAFDGTKQSQNLGNTLFDDSNPTNFHLNTLVQDQRVGDFRPRALMPTKPSVSAYDALQNRRLSKDAIGGWSLGAGLPTYRF